VTTFDSPDQEPTPTAFSAATRNEYDTPFVSPVTTAVVRVVRKTCRLCARVPRYGAITYAPIGEPPELTGSVHCSVAVASPATANTARGAFADPIDRPRPLVADRGCASEPSDVAHKIRPIPTNTVGRLYRTGLHPSLS